LPGGSTSGSFWTDTALTSAVTFPLTITSDTTIYTDRFGNYTFSLKQPDGTELDGTQRRVQPDVPVVVAPLPTAAQVGADVGGAFGIVYTPYQLSTANITIGTANSTRFYRVLEGGTISKVRVSIGTSSGNIAAAAYSNSGSGLSSAPGTRLATSGSIASPGTGVQDISLGSSVTLRRGDWIAIGADNTSVTFGGTTGVGGSTLDAGLCGSEAVFPPAATVTFVPGNNRAITLIGVP
jgi:hypothetical protein